MSFTIVFAVIPGQLWGEYNTLNYLYDLGRHPVGFDFPSWQCQHF